MAENKETAVPKWALPHVKERKEVHVDGEAHDYFIMHPTLPGPKNFMGYLPDDGFLFISDEVPGDLHTHCMRYEVRVGKLGARVDRCRLMLAQTLDEAARSFAQRAFYWHMRGVFENVIRFYEENPNQKGEKVENLKLALADGFTYLQEIEHKYR